MRQRLEYAPVWVIVRIFAILPRPVARGLGIVLAHLIRVLHRRLWHVGMRNLELAFPEKPLHERRRILRGVYTSLGRLLAEFTKFPEYTGENVKRVAVYEGFENFERARERGRGVLFMTAHLGGWEVGAFAHSAYGNPLNVMMRELDNPYLDHLVTEYRSLHGNRMMLKDDFARGLIGAMRRGETVGILMDTNMTPPQGVFVDFLGHLACTASGVAKVALRTGAAVVPAFTIWDKEIGKYRIHFEPPIPLVNTGNDEADAITNTAAFTKKIEEFVRKYPDQWLWVHRRWKARPPGEKSLY
ncbi:MAG: lysophospholipid acyltransferase family protein [Acidobacteriaceae bacterium]